MILNRNKLYVLLFIACIAGYGWLYYSVSTENLGNKPLEVCLIKHVTKVPCPSCGSTRSLLSLTKGNFSEALMVNPLGFLVAIILVLAPLWMIADITTQRKTLFDFYQKTEACLKRPPYSLPLIVLVVANWIWNITKGL